MSVACTKREGESNEKLIGRWKKKAQQAGSVKEFRNAQRFARNTSKTKVKKGALVREKYRSQRHQNRFYA